MIELKNINLEGIDISEQMEKVYEETDELTKALIWKDRENTKEEFYDVVQSLIGILQLSMNITAEELMEYYPKHIEKIKERPRRKES